MEPGILTTILKTFTQTFTQGLARLVPDALGLLAALLVMELILMGIWWLCTHENVLLTVITKTLWVTVLTFCITNWGLLTKTLLHFFLAAGLLAGGDAISETDFTDPGNIAGYGYVVTASLFEHIDQYSGIEAIKNLGEIFMSVPVALLILILYGVLGIWIFVTLLEFYFYASVTVLLLPAALNSKLSFLSEKALAVIFAGGVRVLTLSFVTSAIMPILQAQTAGPNPTFKKLCVQLLGAGAVCALAWRADKLSQGLIYGALQSRVGDVTQALSTTVQTLTRVGGVLHSLHATLSAGAGGRQPVPAPRRRAI